jgi:hypothetical protein
MGSKVFISYRRSESKYLAGHVYDLLAEKISAGEIFFDVDAVPIGVDFRMHISKSVSQSAVMLVIIGDSWLKRRRPFRLRPPEDYVHSEIELDFGVPILPVLVDDAEMPRRDQVPSSIAEFVLLNAARVASGPHFR